MKTKIVITAFLIALFECALALPVIGQEDRWNVLNEQVLQFIQQGFYAEGISVAKEALQVAETTFGIYGRNTAVSLNNLGMLYLRLGRYTNAEPLYRRALTILEKALGPQHPDVATSLNNLAGLYNEQGNYSEAEPLFKRALNIWERAVGPEHSYVAFTLNYLATIYYVQGKYAEAENLYRRILAIWERTFGPEHPNVASSLNNLAEMCREQGKYAEAEPLFKQALEIRKKTLGLEHADVASSLNNLAGLYMSQGKYTEAEHLFKQALAVRETVLGPKHSDVAQSLNNLAALYKLQGSYTEAEELYKRTLAIWKNTQGSEHHYIATSLSNLADLYSEQGKYDKAEAMYKQALNIDIKVHNQDHPIVASDINNLAKLNYAQGNYTEAEAMYKQAIAIQENVLGPENPDLAQSLNNLAVLYGSWGKYVTADSLFKRALAIQERNLGQEHPDVAASMNNLARLYYSLGKYAEVEPLYKRVIAINEKVLGADHPDVAISLNSLAVLYSSQGNYTEAEHLQKRALAIREKALGQEHPDVATSLNNLAWLYDLQGNDAKAEPLYKRALAIQEKILGQEHPDVGTSLNNLALLYCNQGKYFEAEPLYKRALVIYVNALGRYHPNVANVLNNLVSLKVATGRPAQALPLMPHSLSIDEHTIDNVFSITSERDKFAFLNTIQSNYKGFLSLIVNELQESPEAVISGLTAVLRHKGMVLDALYRERQALGTSIDSKVVQITKQLQEVSSRLVTLTLAGPGKKSAEAYRQSIAELETEKEIIENKLARMSKAYDAEHQSRKADCHKLAQVLPSGAVLVEYVVYQTFNFKATDAKEKWGENRYLAFVLPAGSTAKPLLVDLCPTETIDQLVWEFRQEVARAPEDITLLGEAVVERRLAEKGRRLYDLTFAPLKKAIGYSRVLFLSPDGDLNLIPFAALQDESGLYLAETYQLNYLSSGRDLLRFDNPIEKGTETIIIADPDYNLSNNERFIQAQNLVADSVQLLSIERAVSTDLKTITWNPLPGTHKEAIAVSRLLSGEKVRLCLGKEALEEVLKSVQSPLRLHLATHGFFLQTQDRPERLAKGEWNRGIGGIVIQQSLDVVNIENPLLRSGFVLAGANWLGKEELAKGADDGIVTALEVSGIPLWGTDLVVLSACETGVGETRRGEGVFGLRRAFQLAGARTVVMSLWKVDDAATQKLMIDFYRRMKARIGKARALQEASLELMKTRRNRIGAAHPYFWAAFVCVGES